MKRKKKIPVFIEIIYKSRQFFVIIVAYKFYQALLDIESSIQIHSTGDDPITKYEKQINSLTKEVSLKIFMKIIKAINNIINNFTRQMK